MMEALEHFRLEYAGASSAAIRALIREDRGFRGQLEALYERYFHRKLNKGCTNCWLDAYVLLMRFDIGKLKSMAARKFELKAGALLIDVKSGRNDLMATHHNLTDELALYHLRTNPKCIKHFSKYPANWESLAKGTAEEVVQPAEGHDAAENTEEVVQPAEEKKPRREKVTE